MQKKFLIALAISTVLLTGCRRGGNKPTSETSEDVPTSVTTGNTSTTSTTGSSSTSEEALSYTVSFDANGGTGSMASQTVEAETWYRIPECTFVAPSNKEFDYWLIGSTQYDPTDVYYITSDITLKANWRDESSGGGGGGSTDDWTADKTYLDCGYYSMGYPSNKDNPREITTTLSADESSWFNTTFAGDVDNGYRYIYKNSCSDGVTGHKCSVSAYSVSHDGGGLKITDPGTGFGSPMFHHTGAKLEIRFTISSFNNASDKPDENKDTFHIYFFDKNNSYLGKYAFEEGSISYSKTAKEFKCYYTASNCSEVAFFEFRCNAKPYKSSQTYNVGITKCNVKSWERV